MGKVAGILLQKNEIFYFSRSIPAELRYRFNKREIEVSLRTKSGTIAAKSASALSDKLERYWDSLRMEAIYSRELGIKALENTTTAQTGDYKLSSVKLYHRLRGIGKSRLFFEVSTRSIRYLEDCSGHDNLLAVKPLDAGRFRDSQFERGMSSSSVKRVFSTVRAIVNLTIREHGLAIENIFSGTFIPNDGNKKQRIPIPNDLLTQLQPECRNLDDEPRWLIALISDTGMLLAEACGLNTSDINLNTDTPHIDVIEHF